MRFLTHLLFGILSGIIFLDYFPVENKWIFFPAVIIGAIIPDIDYPYSKVGKRFKVISFAISFLFGHRGFIHTIFPPLIVFGLAYYFGYGMIGFGFLLGYIVHLASDGLTSEGVRVFSPFSGFFIQGFVTNGSIFERLLQIAAFAVLALRIARFF